MADGKLGIIGSSTVLNVGDVVRMITLDKETEVPCAFPFSDMIITDVIVPTNGSETNYNLIRPYMHLHVIDPLFGFERLNAVSHESMIHNFRQVLSDRDQPMNCRM
jgi:hypothetical protein